MMKAGVEAPRHCGLRPAIPCHVPHLQRIGHFIADVAVNWHFHEFFGHICNRSAISLQMWPHARREIPERVRDDEIAVCHTATGSAFCVAVWRLHSVSAMGSAFGLAVWRLRSVSAMRSAFCVAVWRLRSVSAMGSAFCVAVWRLHSVSATGSAFCVAVWRRRARSRRCSRGNAPSMVTVPNGTFGAKRRRGARGGTPPRWKQLRMAHSELHHKKSRSVCFGFFVVLTGVEPVTHGFSVHCSTS